jgi:hypothetical protein
MRLVESCERRSACGRSARGELRELRGAHAASRQAAEEERMRLVDRRWRRSARGDLRQLRELREQQRMRLVGRWWRRCA